MKSYKVKKTPFQTVSDHQELSSSFCRNTMNEYLKHRGGFTLLFLGILFFSCSHGRGIYYPGLKAKRAWELKEQMETMLADSALGQSHVGIKIVSLRTGEVFYQHDADRLFTPASNTKLFTAATAVSILTPQYRYATSVWADSMDPGGLVVGNLYLKGSGDPDLATDDLENLADGLWWQGVRAVQGSLVVDNTAFDPIPWGKGWMWDEGPYWYFAPVDAMTLDDNCVTIIVRPGKKEGDPPNIRIEPPTEYIRVSNQAVTVADAAQHERLKVDRRWQEKEDVVEITGTILLGSDEMSFVRSVERPALYAGTVFQELLISRGIEVFGPVVIDTVSQKATLLAEHRSGPLMETVRNFMKISDNLTGESLIKTIGAAVKGPPGSWDKGLMAQKGFLAAEVGLDTAQFKLVDGSGISRYNLVSPGQIVKLLEWAYHNFEIGPEFIATLPTGGADGSLSNRLKAVGVVRKVRAKTGTLMGVSCLSGYAFTVDGEVLAFSILMNGYVGESTPRRKLQDKICEILTNFGR